GARRPPWQAGARAVPRLDHPHLVRVFDSGEADGRPWFALELVEGGTLARALRGGAWQPRAAARLVALLADAVEYAHQRGVVHRDLKPANVLLSAACGLAGPAKPQAALVPKIADFGLARVLDRDGQTDTGAVLGTPRYLAPEQAAGRTREVGPAADVWALGCSL